MNLFSKSMLRLVYLCSFLVLGCGKPTLAPSAVILLNKNDEVIDTVISSDSQTAFVVVNTPKIKTQGKNSYWKLPRYKIQKYHLAEGTLTSELTLPALAQHVVLSPDNTTFLTIEYLIQGDNEEPTERFHLHNMTDGSIIQTFQAPRKDKMPRIVDKVGFLGDGSRVWSFHKDWSLFYIWNSTDGQIQAEFNLWQMGGPDFIGPITNWSFSKDGSILWLQTGLRSYVFDLRTKTMLLPTYTEPYYKDTFNKPDMEASFSPDGSQLVLTINFSANQKSYGTERILLWDLKEKKLRWSKEGVASQEKNDTSLHQISYVSFLPDAKNLAITYTNHPTEVLDAQTGQILTTLPSSEYNWQSHLTFSHDGSILAGTSLSVKEAVIWSAQTGEILYLLSPERQPAPYYSFDSPVVISPDGTRAIAYGHQFKESWFTTEVVKDPLPHAIRIWNLPS